MLVLSFNGANGMLLKKELLPKTALLSTCQNIDQLCELVSGAAHWRRINSLSRGDEEKIKKGSIAAVGCNVISASRYLYSYWKNKKPGFDSREKASWLPLISIIKHMIEGAAAYRTYQNAKQLADDNEETDHFAENYKKHLGLFLAGRTALIGSNYTGCNTTKLITQALSPFWSAYELYLSFLNDKKTSEKR